MFISTYIFRCLPIQYSVSGTDSVKLTNNVNNVEINIKMMNN